MSGLIWVQTVCKGCLQTTKYITGRQVKSKYLVFGFICLFLIQGFTRGFLGGGGGGGFGGGGVASL